MTTRLQSRLERAEAKASAVSGDGNYRMFYIGGGHGYVETGKCTDDLKAFLRSKGHDLGGNFTIAHSVPWDSERRCWKDEPLMDLTAKYGRAA